MIGFTPGGPVLGVDFASFGPLGPRRAPSHVPTPDPGFLCAYHPAVVMSFPADFVPDAPAPVTPRPS